MTITALPGMAQYRDIRNAWESGFESPEWRTMMGRLAEELKKANEVVEDNLAAREQVSLETASVTVSSPEPDPDAIEPGGVLDLLVDFEEQINAMTQTAANLGATVERLGNVAQNLAPPDPTKGAKAAQASILMAARSFKLPAQELEYYGSELNAQIVLADSQLRSMSVVAQESGVADVIKNVQDGVHGIVENLGDMSEIYSQMQILLDGLCSAEAMSASLRKALKPARVGVTNVRDAINILAGWQDLIG